MRPIFASALCFLAVTMTLPAQTTSRKKIPVTAATADAVHRSAIVIDTHADTPQRFVDNNFDMSDPLNGGALNLQSAKTGNLGAEFFSIWVDPVKYKGHEAHRALVLIDSVYQQVAKHPSQMMMAYSPEDIERAHREHKLAALMGVEGGHAIENNLGILRDYYRLGVRYMTLTWENSNGWADSSTDANDTSVPHTANGLSEFGKDVVYQMNRMGMMVDISHVSDKTFYRTLIISRAPVIASHSGARALCNAPRNMTDDMLRALANNGGVVQVNFYSAFVSEPYREAMEAQEPLRKKAEQEVIDKAKADGKPFPSAEIDAIDQQFDAKLPRPPLSALIDQIDHIAKVAGVDHVGLGSDFDGMSATPEGMDSVADLPKITEALMARGYSAEDVRKILGGNLLRVFRQVQAIAKEMQANSPADRPQITEKQPR